MLENIALASLVSIQAVVLRHRNGFSISDLRYEKTDSFADSLVFDFSLFPSSSTFSL
jgi:hypothetical protein